MSVHLDGASKKYPVVSIEEQGMLNGKKISIVNSDKPCKIAELIQTSAIFKDNDALLQDDPKFYEAKDILKMQVNELDKKRETLSISEREKLDIVIQNLGLSRKPVTAELKKEIESVLAASFDLKSTPIESITIFSELGRRNRLIRITLHNSTTSIIFKESFPKSESRQEELSLEDKKEALSRFYRERCGLEIATSLNVLPSITPRLYGTSDDHHFILIEDLGKQKTLDTFLNGNNRQETKEAFIKFLQSLGRLHAESHGKVQQPPELLESSNARNEVLQELDILVSDLGLSLSTHTREKVAEVIDSVYDPTGAFACLGHGDACSENAFNLPDRCVLIDFEYAHVESALLDATYLRMCMPTAQFAGRFPEDLIQDAETVYRNELIKKIPDAKDDKKFGQAYTEACAFHALNHIRHLRRDCFIKDDDWGDISKRTRIITQLEIFIDVSKKQNCLPEVREMAENILEALQNKWPPVAPLPTYPVFQD